MQESGGRMRLTRGEFVKGSMALLGFLALPWTPVFAAPVGWKPQGKPNLVLGILSDTHLMVEWDGKSLYRSMTLDSIRNAFKLFKARGIDAFLHLGDASHRGCVREWEFHKEVCGMYPPSEINLPVAPASFRSTDLPFRQTMVVNVYDDMVVFERHDVAQGGKLRPDWVPPLGSLKPRPAPHPFSRNELKKVIGAPEFGKKAKLEVVRASTVLPDLSDPEKKPSKPDSNAPKTACVRIKIPMADGNPRCRVYAYNVVVVGDDMTVRYFKSEYFSGVNCGIGHEPSGCVTTVDIPLAELPAGKTQTVAGRPVSSLGMKGKSIATKFQGVSRSTGPRT